MLYHLARHRMVVERQYSAAAYLFRSLDHFMSSIHPSKFDEQNTDPRTGKPLWPISDYLVSLLRAEIARESSGRSWDLGPFKKDQKPYHGNMYIIKSFKCII